MRLVLMRQCAELPLTEFASRRLDRRVDGDGARECGAAGARDGEHAVLASAASVRRRGHYDRPVRVRPPSALRVRRLLLLEEVRAAASCARACLTRSLPLLCAARNSDARRRTRLGLPAPRTNSGTVGTGQCSFYSRRSVSLCLEQLSDTVQLCRWW